MMNNQSPTPLVPNLKFRMKTCALLLTGAASALPSPLSAKESKQPNILCITVEDIQPYLGCYGDKVAVSPNLDRFAKSAIRFERMFTTVGVSSPSRAALITGMYPSAIGANYMRNNTIPSQMPADITPYDVVLPAGVKCYSEYMRAAGYYCTNNSKTDYQFAAPLTAWDANGKEAHWKNRPKGKPFFAIFNIEVTHESQIWRRTDMPLAVKPEDVVLPPYYPDDPIVRHDMAVMYSNIAEMDKRFQVLMNELKAAGEEKNTIVIWYSDNGGPLPRQKRAIYESGMRVPFMISFPDGYRAGEVEDRMCMFPDIPATILSLAGIKPPTYMQGVPFLGKYQSHEKRSYVYGARNRMDEQRDKQGAVRDERFRYVRNYTPERPNYIPVGYRLQMPMMRRLIELLQQDKLNETQMRWFVAPRGKEEFYDVVDDPYEVNNLIADPRYAADIERMRKELDRWIAEDCPRWKKTEKENQESMWAEGKQPVLKAPTCTLTKQGISITSKEEGVSFAYQIDGKGYTPEHWFLYTKPIKLKKGQKLTAVSVRAGMKNSPAESFVR